MAKDPPKPKKRPTRNKRNGAAQPAQDQRVKLDMDSEDALRVLLRTPRLPADDPS